MKGITDYSLYYKLDIAEIFCTLLFFPLVYFYFRALTNEKPFGWKTYFVLLPGLLLGVVLTFLYLIMGDKQATDYIREAVESGGHLQVHTAMIYRVHFFLNTYGCLLLVLMQIIGVMTYATVQLYRYRNRLNEFFSNMEGKSLVHHWAVLRGLYTFFIAVIFVLIGGYTFYVQYSLFGLLRFVAMAGILYYMCYHVHFARYTADNFVDEIAQVDKVESSEEESSGDGASGLDLGYDSFGDTHREDLQKNYSKILPHFIRIIEEDRIFLQKNLRLSDVAREIGTNRTYISQLLKEEYQCTFFDFINRKRIEYAMELVRIHPEFKQGQIAEECGFIHASVFSRAFKQHAGMTFREWCRKDTEPDGSRASV